MKNAKRPVHFGNDHIERAKLENEQRQCRSLEQIAAEATSANVRAENAEKQSSKAWRVSVAAVAIAALALLVDFLKLAFGG